MMGASSKFENPTNLEIQILYFVWSRILVLHIGTNNLTSNPHIPYTAFLVLALFHTIVPFVINPHTP